MKLKDMPRKLIALIPTYGKTKEQIFKEFEEAFRKYQQNNITDKRATNPQIVTKK